MNLVQRKNEWKAVVMTLVLLPAISLAQALPDFTGLVEKNAPAIVNVSTELEVDKADQQRRSQLQDLLRQFYGERNQQPFGNRGQVPDLEEEPEEEEEQGGAATGSAFIIESDGYIVTNHHVVDRAKKVKVTLNDQREFEAKVIGTDEQSDLALLKIEATKLPVVKLGDSDKLKVGEWVLAIGSPFGLEYSVAAGIVSYMGRSLPTGSRQGQRGNYVSYIQTDVAINPGHSGGPLFNLAGEVVGINSQIFTSTGGSIGLSFAIPVGIAKNVVAQLRETGKVERGYLGVNFGNVTQELAEGFHLDRPHGALVSSVVKGGPADNAGFKSGDVIIKFNGHDIRKGEDLPFHVGQLKPGTEVSADLIRDGKPMSLKVKIGNLKDANAVSQTGPQAAPGSGRLGLIVSPLDAKTKKELDIDGGVKVEAVSGPARAARLQAGDIVVSINSVTINSQQDLQALEPRLPAKRPIPVLVIRNDQQRFVTIRIEE